MLLVIPICSFLTPKYIEIGSFRIRVTLAPGRSNFRFLANIHLTALHGSLPNPCGKFQAPCSHNIMTYQIAKHDGERKHDCQLQSRRQEYGGKSNAKRIVQTKARIGKNEKKRTSKKYYFNKYKDSKNGQVERTNKHTIIKTDYSILMVEKGGKWSTLYRLKRNSEWDAKPFIEPSAKLAHLQAEKIFRNLAKKRIMK